MATIKTTPRAQAALRAAIAAHGDRPLRLAIDERFQHELYFDPRTPNDEDVPCGGGISLIVDAATAERAGGMTIDYLGDGAEQGFKIDNPNAPAKIRQLTAPELKAMIERGETFELVDVRTPEERAIARLPGSRLLDQAYVGELLTRDPNTPLVFHCHHGVRSQAAAEFFQSHGFRNLSNLAGGIDAWSLLCDANVPHY